MADNVNITPGTGQVIAADDVSSVFFQKIKLDLGTDGATAPAVAGAGVVSTGVQRITLASDDPGVALLTTIDVDTGAMVTDLAAIEVLLGTIDTDTGAMAVDLAALEVDLAAIEVLQTTIAGDTTSIDGKITACNTGAVVLATGSAAIGKLAANTGVDIGDVDILSIAAGDNNIGNVDIVTVPAPLNVVGGGTEAAALRVTLANDSTGVITVDGTVTANLSATDNTVLDNMLTALQLIDNPIDGAYFNVNMNIAGTDAAAGEGVISAQTQRVTLATDDDAVAHLATIAGAVSTQMQCDIVEGTVTTVSTVTNLSQLGGIAITMDEGVHGTGCQRVTIATDDDGVLSLGIIDDWDATHASAASADGPQVMGAGYSAGLPTDVGADGDAARICTDRYGRLCTGLQPQATKAICNNADTTTARAVVAAVADRKIYITSLVISVDTAGNYWLEDGDATAVTSKMYFAANGGCAITFPEGTPLNTVTVNKALNVKGSIAGNVGVTVTYYLAP